MSETTVSSVETARAKPGAAGRGGLTVASIAWRNLWRNRRRTWLTSGGIAFAVLLMMFGRATQDGSFDMMTDNATRSFPGHIQIQHRDYFDEPRLRHTVEGVDALVAELRGMQRIVAVSPRVSAFALASVEERSFGAQVIGVRPEAEFASVFTMGLEGRPVAQPGEALLGSVLARNLGAHIGDELVLLGSSREGGVAAAAATTVGTFTSGQVELDRAVVQMHYDHARDAFELGDEAHVLALLTDDVDAARDIARQIEARTGERAVAWSELLPEIEQMIDLKHTSSNMIYMLVLVLVTFSVVNAFIMTVFERTQEIGMLLAVGMRPGAVVRMLQFEALWMSLIGVAVGLAVSSAIIASLQQTGIYLGAEYAEILEQYQMPDRLYPAFNVPVTIAVCAVFVAAVQVAAIVPALRVTRLDVVSALRSE